MAEELVLNPSEFQEEIDGYDGKNQEIGAVAYQIEPGDLQLDSIDKLQECIETMNRIISKLNALGQQEVKNMQNIKSAWMNLDEEMGDKMLIDLVADSVNSIINNSCIGDNDEESK